MLPAARHRTGGGQDLYGPDPFRRDLLLRVRIKATGIAGTMLRGVVDNQVELFGPMIENLIVRARRRLALNETMAQFAFAAAVCVGGFVLMLIVGTRFLEWWTLGLFAAVGLGIGAYKVYRRMPDSYST